MHASTLMFLITILPLYVQTEVKNASDNYLPLVFIMNQNGQLQYPNKIVKADIKENIGFTGDTLFSTDASKKQFFFCPPESDEQKNQIEKYNKVIQTSSRRIRELFSEKKASENCLFSKTFGKEDPLRLDATPVIYLLKEGEPGKEIVKECGHDEKGVFLKFIYEKLPFVYTQLTVYEICYNRNDGETMYTKHTVSPVNLLFAEKLKHEEEKKHTMMTEAINELYLTDDFTKLKEFYEDLLKNPTVKQNQLFNEDTADIVETHNVYLAEKLVPPDDFMLAVLKKPTFHYINVKPMHQALVELWNYTAELIRKTLRDKKTENPIEIYTGAFTLTTTLPPDIPEIWIKIIYEKTPNPFNSLSLVITMKNDNEPEKGLYDDVWYNVCGLFVDHCKSFKQDEVVFKKFSHLLEKIRCCPLNGKIAALFGEYFIHGNILLPVADLTDKEE